MRQATRGRVEPAGEETARAEEVSGDRRALGMALALRAQDLPALMDERLRRNPRVGPPPSPEYAALVARINEFAAVLIARYLATGVRAGADEVAYIAERGAFAASERQSSANITRAYFAWRDTVCDVLAEEAARLETPYEVLGPALNVVRRSCDYSLLQVATTFDQQVAVVSEQLEFERRALAHQALHDPLTGLPNRLLLEDRLDQAVLGATRSETRFALLSIDLDRFKSVNDVHGHRFGDGVLRRVARRLHDAARRSDTVARVGGDEFLALLPSADAPAAQAITARMLDALQRPVKVDRLSFVIGASIGTALFPVDGRDASTLLSVADARMYATKTATEARPVLDEDDR